MSILKNAFDLDAAVARAVDEFGGLDIMCNIAGVPGNGMLESVSEEHSTGFTTSTSRACSSDAKQRSPH